MGIKEYCFSGQAIKPKVRIRDTSGRILSEKRDYILICNNNIHPGTGSLIAAGIGKYKGFESRMDFKITGIADIKKSNNRDGEPCAATVIDFFYGPKYIITDTQGRILKEGIDYSVVMSIGKNGSHPRFKYKGFYAPLNNTQLIYPDRWKERSIASVKILPIPCLFTGNSVCPPVIVKDEEGHTVPSCMYDIEYRNNVDPGEAMVIVRGKDGCSGIGYAVFTIKRK